MRISKKAKLEFLYSKLVESDRTRIYIDVIPKVIKVQNKLEDFLPFYKEIKKSNKPISLTGPEHTFKNLFFYLAAIETDIFKGKKRIEMEWEYLRQFAFPVLITEQSVIRITYGINIERLKINCMAGVLKKAPRKVTKPRKIPACKELLKNRMKGV
ncbi:hypothetical protein KAU11_11410 [Candidatus Babeliales bacterium]|nr:hypothetical protein [Candidatus Babeliales bacterium]